MSGDASLSIQKAIYAALTSNVALMALISGVFDSVPVGQAFPYVTIGDDTARDWSSATFDGMNSTLTIHSWTQSGSGRSSVKTIMAAVYGALHNQRLSVAGQALVDLKLDFATTDLDPDGITYHGVQRFRALTQGV